MPFETKPLDQLMADDLAALLAEDNDWARERRTVDYKVQLPGQAPDDPWKFADDVASFANASGGHLIFGIREADGLPVELVGSEVEWDAEQNRLRNILQSRIEPNLPLVDMQPVDLGDGRSCLVIRVGQSWIGPHRVRLAQTEQFRFSTRVANGRQALDYHGLRAAFLLSESRGDRIRAFRDQRLARLMSERSAEVPTEPYIVMQLVPISAFETIPVLDLRARQIDFDFNDWRYGHWQRPGRFNLDGYLFGGHDSLQIYRTGVLEAVCDLSRARGTQSREIRLLRLDLMILNDLGRLVWIVDHLRIAMPLVVMITLVGVGGEVVGFSEFPLPVPPRFEDRNPLILPDLLLDRLPEVPVVQEPLERLGGVARATREILDAIWDAAGEPGSQSFDEHGALTHTRAMGT